jgi:lysozyme family protein
MADWDTSYNWMMDNEDRARACAQVPDPPPAGSAGPCYAISGINSGAWPDQFEAIAALAQTDRVSAVQQFYQDHFWNDWFAQVASDDLCKRVFDFAVNGGHGTAVHCLQQAVNSLATDGAAPIAEDGGWGPITLNAVNAADPAALLEAFKAKRLAYYQDIANEDPAKARYLATWTTRAEM